MEGAQSGGTINVSRYSFDCSSFGKNEPSHVDFAQEMHEIHNDTGECCTQNVWWKRTTRIIAIIVRPSQRQQTTLSILPIEFKKQYILITMLAD